MPKYQAAVRVQFTLDRKGLIEAENSVEEFIKYLKREVQTDWPFGNVEIEPITFDGGRLAARANLTEDEE